MRMTPNGENNRSVTATDGTAPGIKYIHSVACCSRVLLFAGKRVVRCVRFACFVLFYSTLRTKLRPHGRQVTGVPAVTCDFLDFEVLHAATQLKRNKKQMAPSPFGVR